MKKERKTFLKIWKSLRSTFKWLLIIILIFLLISLIKDFLDHYHFLVGRVTEQNHTINTLQNNIHDLKHVNSYLVDQLHTEHSKVEHLQQQLSVKINGQPVHMNVNDIKKEIEPQLKFQSIDDAILPVTIFGIITSVLQPLLFKLAF